MSAGNGLVFWPAWGCTHCGRNSTDIATGDHQVHHELVCLGPAAPYSCCMFCGPLGFTPAGTVISHYSQAHGLGAAHVGELVRRYRLEHMYPPMDMNFSYGLLYTRDSVIHPYADLREASLESEMRPYNQPVGKWMEAYRKDFRDYFGGAVPMSFQAHVSDIVPDTIASILSYLLGFCDSPAGLEMAAAARKRSDVGTQVAVLDSCYGAAYGPLAHVAQNDDNVTFAHGCQPYDIRVGEPDELRAKIARLPDDCTMLFVQIVSSADGDVLSQEQWEAIAEACLARRMFLVVDEALTAIRCGAPFAHLRPEYARYKPSIVLFGKALVANGFAVYPDGVTMSLLEITSEEMYEIARDTCDGRLSQAIDFGVLLRAIGTLRRAREENWIGRAVAIGAHLRAVAAEIGVEEEHCMGLDALVYVDTETGGGYVQGAAAGPDMLRWIAPLELSLCDEGAVRLLFGRDGYKARRAHVEAYGPTRYCIVCGNSVYAPRVCERCHCRFCRECGLSAAGKRHVDGKC